MMSPAPQKPVAAKTPNGPPKDIGASELWIALTQIPRPWEVVDFPRKDPITGAPVGQLAIWVLTQEEQVIASTHADKGARKLLGEDASKSSIGYETVYENEAVVWVLWFACRNVKNIKETAFPTPELLKKQLSVDEISALAKLYLQTQYKLGPIVAQMSSEEEEAWIRRLAEGGSVFPTALLSQRELERLVSSMASRLVSYWTDTSSVGSPLSEVSTSEGVGEEPAVVATEEEAPQES